MLAVRPHWLCLHAPSPDNGIPLVHSLKHRPEPIAMTMHKARSAEVFVSYAFCSKEYTMHAHAFTTKQGWLGVHSLS